MVSGQTCREELERVLSSTCFARSERVSKLLRFLVERRLEGREGELKESVIGVEVFGRRPDYNPKLDSTVRTEAVRLRARLDRYYAVEGSGNPLSIELPKGAYVPVFNEHRDGPAIGAAARRRDDLPIQLTPLVGREKALAAAKQLLLREDVRLVTFTGAGGTGKTRLALRTAEDVAESFPGGIYFVRLASISDPGLVIPSIAGVLGVRETAGKPLFTNLKEYLRDSDAVPMLLLLDNFEQVTSAAGMVAELLEAAQRIKIVVTSRALLRVYGEYELPVAPLALPDPLASPDVQILSDSPAVALFLQRAVALKPEFALTEENAQAVAEICARVDGLPLAIELAAARIKLLSPAAMLIRLRSRLQLLTGGARDLPERQQTLRSTIDWSYELLTGSEQKLFRRLSVFPAGWTIEAAEAACNSSGDLGADLLDGIASLADKSLVQQSESADDEMRFSMLETIREYALERLGASHEEPATRRAHAAFCVILAEEGAGQLTGAERRAWIDRFDLEQDNFRAALDWLTQTGGLEWGVRLGNALHLYWQDHAHQAEGGDRLRDLLDLPAAAARTPLRARLLFLAGSLCQAADTGYSQSALREALAIYKEMGNKVGAAAASTHLAVACRDGNDPATARLLFSESIRLWQQAGDPISAAHTMSNLADVALGERDYESAARLHAECLSIFERAGDRAGIAWSLNHQGDVAREQGSMGGARALYEQAVAMFRELDDRTGIARSLADLGNLACHEGNYSAAQGFYSEALTLFCHLGEAKLCARVLESIACAAVGQEFWTRALRVAGAAARIRQRFRFPLTAAAKENLDRGLEPALRSMSEAEAAGAWRYGWSMPLERSIEYAVSAEPV